MTTQIKFTTAEEAVKVIKSGDHVHLSSVASAPQCLINAMCARGEAGELKDVHIHHLHTEGPAPYADEKFEGVFQLDSFFVGGNVRKVTQSGYADYIPIFLSETQRLYRCGAVPCNVAMIQVSTPDKHKQKRSRSALLRVLQLPDSTQRLNYFTMLATSAAKSSARFSRPSPFWKRANLTILMSPPRSLATLAVY